MTKPGTYVVLRRVWKPIYFQGQRSRSQGLIFRRVDTPRFALPLLSLGMFAMPFFATNLRLTLLSLGMLAMPFFATNLRLTLLSLGMFAMPFFATNLRLTLLSLGMFAINTDHAANLDLSRHANGWIFWSSNALYLAWLGFSDVHSGVEYYKVTVGSSYMASNLCKVRYISSLLQYSGPPSYKAILFCNQVAL